jgi:hypothetical protein
MRISEIKVTHGATVNTGDYESKRIDLELRAFLDEMDDPEIAFEQLKRGLIEKVTTWEKEIKDRVKELGSIRIETKKQGNLTGYGNGNGQKTATEVIKIEESYTCPKCGEQMQQKEGKEYYMCGKHWGYPDMILKGEVRD